MTTEATPPAPQPLNIPVFGASSVHIISSGNELIFTFSALQPSLSDEGLAIPVVALNLARGTATDLKFVLTSLLDQLDKDLGEITTPYMKAKAEGK